MRPSLAATVALVMLAGCGAMDRVAPDFEIADSAGVQIVTSRAPQWGPDDAWTLAPEASLTIGQAEGSEGEMLYNVGTARRLGDGRIAVANNGTAEIRFFEGDGSYIGRAGGQGDGPGEFRALSRFETALGDTLIVFDSTLRRVSLFDPQGTFVRSFTVPTHDDSRIGLAGVFGDGTLLARTIGTYSSLDERVGIVRDPIANVRMDSQGRILGTIGAFPGNEAYFPPSEHPYTVVLLPLQKISRYAIARNSLVIGEAEAYEYRVYSTSAELERIVRRVTEPDPITPQDIETVVNARLEREQNEQSRAQLAAMYRSAPYPESMPAYGAFLADAAGNVWIDAYRFGDLPRTVGDVRVWSVFSPEGVWLGDVTMPLTFGAAQIGEDFVLGVRRDELGIERVEMYALRKGAK